MALIGYEIIQSRTWIDPNAGPAPLLNHKNVFPITVFDAVRENMYDDNSRTLQQALEEIDIQIKSKQPLIPAKSANNLMTYGGAAGVVGSIKISESIPADVGSLSSNKIPTEQAIGKYVTESIDYAVNNRIRVTWNDIIGKPTLYQELGADEFGLVSQKGLTSIIAPAIKTLDNISNDYIGYSNPVIKNRPPDTACDEDGNGNLIPDIQWVLNKVTELILKHEEEFMEKLKDILPCFTTPPPPPKTDEVIEPISAEDISGIVDGTIEGVDSDSINISGYLMSRIPDSIVVKLVNGEVEPVPPDRIVVENIWIEGIDEDTVEGLVNGTVEPEPSEAIVIPAELIEDEGCGCPCCTGELYEPDEIIEEKSIDTSVTVMSADVINQLVESASDSI